MYMCNRDVITSKRISHVYAAVFASYLHPYYTYYMTGLFAGYLHPYYTYCMTGPFTGYLHPYYTYMCNRGINNQQRDQSCICVIGM
jgi:hypothetical protein